MKTADLCVRDWSFLAAKNSYQDAQVVLTGIPLDLTSSFRPGSRQGPQAIRSASEGLEEYSPYLNLDLVDCLFYDGGDLLLPHGNLQVCFERAEHLCRLLLQDNKLPVFLGGEHLITFPIVKAMLDFYPGVEPVKRRFEMAKFIKVYVFSIHLTPPYCRIFRTCD